MTKTKAKKDKKSAKPTAKRPPKKGSNAAARSNPPKAAPKATAKAAAKAAEPIAKAPDPKPSPAPPEPPVQRVTAPPVANPAIVATLPAVSATPPAGPSEPEVDPRTVVFSMKGTGEWAEWFDGLVEHVASRSKFATSRTKVAEEAFRLYASRIGYHPPPERMFRRGKRKPGDETVDTDE